jgi:Asp-tRNA(Asn)/Glu-tRNA(Gln) amidotransferase A subunit family amidase
MLVPAKLWSLTAIEVLDLIKRDLVTVEDYAKSLLNRIESRDSEVKAWQYLGRSSSLSNVSKLA